MITQITIDGKDRIAIVFDEHFSFDSLYLLRRNLLSTIKALQCSEIIGGGKDIPEIYDIVTLLEETELGEDEFIKYFRNKHR